MTDVTLPPSDAASSPSSLARKAIRFIAAIGEAISEARRMNQAYRDLSRLSDRELADIGITRGDIPSVVAGMRNRQAS